MSETKTFLLLTKKTSFQNRCLKFQEGLYAADNLHCNYAFFKILTKNLKLHLSITLGQQHNAFEQSQVTKC